MHLLIFMILIGILNLSLQSDLNTADPKAWSKYTLLALLGCAFTIVAGTLIGYWWHSLTYCPTELRWHPDSLSSLTLGIVMLLAFGAAVITMARKQLFFCQLLTSLNCHHSDENNALQRQVDTLAIELRLRRPVKLRITPQQDMLAMSCAFPRSMILLSETTVKSLDQQELQAVLSHELCHIKAQDSLLSIVCQALCTMLWFIPASNRSNQIFQYLVEREADSKAVRLNHGQSGALASALLKFMLPQQSLAPELVAKKTEHSLLLQHFLKPLEANMSEKRLEALLAEEPIADKATSLKSILRSKTFMLGLVWLSLLLFLPYCLYG